jgi:hypothetical protein
MTWVGVALAGWLLAPPMLLPALGRLIRIGQRPAPAHLVAGPARPRLRSVPDLSA